MGDTKEQLGSQAKALSLLLHFEYTFIFQCTSGPIQNCASASGSKHTPAEPSSDMPAPEQVLILGVLH